MLDNCLHPLAECCTASVQPGRQPMMALVRRFLRLTWETGVELLVFNFSLAQYCLLPTFWSKPAVGRFSSSFCLPFPFWQCAFQKKKSSYKRKLEDKNQGLSASPSAELGNQNSFLLPYFPLVYANVILFSCTPSSHLQALSCLPRRKK